MHGKRTLLGISLAVVIAGALACIVPMGIVTAISGSDFKAGYIIDDSVFFKQDDMSLANIQAFLNAKVPVCDTNGTQPYAGTTAAAYGTSKGYPPPYTCLKDFRQDTVSKPVESGLCNGYPAVNQSAAEIIYGVAQSCGVNPKVLLVLLQKEQGLVTDDWPWPVEYQKATGYGCPDSSSCDSTYYGFFNQVYAAARQFKNYQRNNSSFNFLAQRNNFIPYSTDSSCGGSTVYITNIATSALYDYTPYQPNAAALNNLYGTGDSCSAYGNRNFWRTYQEWFGSPYLYHYDDISFSQHSIQPVRFNNTLYTFYYNALQQTLMVASKADGASTWQVSTFDGKVGSGNGRVNANVGASITTAVFNNTLHVFYYDKSNGNLRHAYSTDGTNWQYENLDGDPGSIGGRNADLGINPTATVYYNTLQLFYYDRSSGSLRHAWLDTANHWTFEQLDGDKGGISQHSGDTGSFSTAIQYGNSLQLFYYAADLHRLVHAWTSTEAGWRFENLDGTPYSISKSPIGVGLSPTVSVLGDSLQLFYYEGNRTNLRHAWTSTTRGWQFEDLDGDLSAISKTVNDTGLTTFSISHGDVIEVYYYDRLNGNLRRAWVSSTQGWQFVNIDGDPGSFGGQDGDVGIQSGALYDENSVTHVFYYNRTNGTLRHAFLDNAGWHFEDIDQNVIY